MKKIVKKTARRFHFDAAGWEFWTVLFVIFTFPFTYLSWIFRDKSASFFTSLIFGIFASAITAGLIAWAVNSILQWRTRRQRIEGRKKVKKHH